MQEVTRKYRKELSNNHWRVRLYKYSTGRDLFSDFKGYCPAFWATNALIGLLPLTVAGKFCEFAWGVVAKTWSGAKTEKKYRPFDEVLIQFKCYLEEGGSPVNFNPQFGYLEDFLKWVEENPNWQELVPAAEKRLEEEKAQNILKDKIWLEKLEKRRVERVAKEAKIQKIKESLAPYKERATKFLSPLLKPLMWVSSLGIGFGILWVLWKGFKFLANSISAAFIWEALKILGIILITVISFFVILYNVNKFAENLKAKLDALPEVPQKEKGPNVFDRIGTFFGAIKEFVKDIYNIVYVKQCPLIIKSDKTKPIEKNL